MRIKEVLKEKGITVSELADKMGISRVGLSQHIHGNPSVDVLERIASALNVSVSELFERDETTALVFHKGSFYRATSIPGLESILSKCKQIDEMSLQKEK